MTKSIARDSTLNLIVQVAVAAVAFLCVPNIVRLMGTERFGLLSILWMFVGYLGLLDLGLGNAAIKYFSEHLSRDEHAHAAALFRTVIVLSLLLSVVWCIGVLFVAWFGIEHFMQIPGEILREARISTILLALCIPAVLLQGPLRSVLYAFRRFDLLNMIQAGSGVAQWGGTLLTLFLGGGLVQVVILTLFVRYCALLVNVLVCRSIFPLAFESETTGERRQGIEVLKFGGWVTVPQIVSPLIVFFERLVIANLISLASVSFFTVPNDAIMRLVIIPMSLATTLFPSISGIWWNVESRSIVKKTYFKAIKYTFLTMAPIAAVLTVLSTNILTHWMGGEFAAKSGPIFTLFSVGILFHSLSQISNVTVVAIGRPDIPAKMLLLEAPLYIGCTYLLTMHLGINGTAISWVLRTAVETTILYGSVQVLMRGVEQSIDMSFVWKGAGLTGLILIITLLAKSLVGDYTMVFVITFLATAYIASVWLGILDREDREMVLKLILPGNAKIA